MVKKGFVGKIACVFFFTKLALLAIIGNNRLSKNWLEPLGFLAGRAGGACELKGQLAPLSK